MKKAILGLVGLVALLAAASASAQDAPSVAVTTAMPHLGTLPELVTVFGTAAPAADGSTTISMQSDGRVERLAVTPGEAVKQGQRLLDFAFSAGAVSTYQQAMHALTLAQTQRTHVAQLLAQQLATRDQLAQADKAVADAQSTLEALRREGADQPRTSLDAPFDGIITTIQVAQGDRVQPGAPLLTLLRADGLVVTVGIEPADRARLSAGQPAELHSMSAGTVPAASGHLVRIDGMLNPKTRLVDADVASAAPLLPGESFRVDIIVGQKQGWLVPRNAVLSDDKGAYLFQTKSGKAARIDVTIVAAQGDTSAVAGPIDAQSPIVIDGNYQLTDGAAVRETSAS